MRDTCYVGWFYFLIFLSLMLCCCCFFNDLHVFYKYETIYPQISYDFFSISSLFRKQTLYWKFLPQWITKLYFSIKCILLCTHSSPAHPMSLWCARVYCVFALNHTSILIGGNLALHITRDWHWCFLNLPYKKN